MILQLTGILWILQLLGKLASLLCSRLSESETESGYYENKEEPGEGWEFSVCMHRSALSLEATFPYISLRV